MIAYASRLLTEQEKHYTTTEKECLAFVWAVRKFRPYLKGHRFTAISDHVALRWLMSLQQPFGRLARWVIELQQHDFEIQYRKGTLNRVADPLSQQPVGSSADWGPEVSVVDDRTADGARTTEEAHPVVEPSP